MEEPRTIDGCFCSCVARFPQRDFLHHITPAGEHRRMTWAQAAGRVLATAEALTGLGFGPGDFIAVWADDVVPMVELFLACFHLGVVPVPLSPSFSLAALLELVRRTQARAVFALGEAARQLAAHGVPALTILDGPAPPGVTSLPAGVAAPAEGALARLTALGRGRRLEAPLLITPTSGSTGEPKLPLWSHLSMERAAENLRRALAVDDRKPHRFLLANALTHGLGVTLLCGALEVGATLCVPSRIDVRTPLAEARALNFTCSFMTPRVLKALYAELVQAGRDPHGERLLGPHAECVALAGALPEPASVRLLLAQGVDVVDIWGSSETGNIAASERGHWEEGYVGRPFPGITVQVLGDGELAVRSPHLFLGYHGEPELTRAAFTPDGFYRSGDAGRLTADGRVQITGRTRDVFNTHEGTNIFPARIEQAIEALPWVYQATLVGDRLPFVSALIVVVGADKTSEGPDGDGWLDPARHASLYDQARAALAALNASLESIERVRRCYLFCRPFGPVLYERVGAIGKVRRNRPAIYAACETRIQALYGERVEPGACV